MKDTTRKNIYVLIICLLFICCGALAAYVYRESLNSNTLSKDFILKTTYQEYDQLWVVSLTGFVTNECHTIRLEKDGKSTSKNIKVNAYYTDKSKTENCNNVDNDVYFVNEVADIEGSADAKVTVRLIEESI